MTVGKRQTPRTAASCMGALLPSLLFCVRMEARRLEMRQWEWGYIAIIFRFIGPNILEMMRKKKLSNWVKMLMKDSKEKS